MYYSIVNGALMYVADYSTKDENGCIQIQSSQLHPHLDVTLEPAEMDVVRKLKDNLNCFGLKLLVTDDNSSSSISITHIPSCFLVRELSEVLIVLKIHRQMNYLNW